MKKALSIFCFITLITSFILLPFFYKETPLSLQQNGYKAVIKLWHIDSFEGGAGSRASFLKSVGNKFTKTNKGVLVLVTALTSESAVNRIENGEVPDLISFGGSSVNVFNNLLTQSTLSVKDGGEYLGKRYLTAWCKGGYFKITKGNKESSKLIVSQGKFNLATVAVCLEKLTAKSVVIKEPLEAYSLFLNSENACLLGTQRDVVRLTNRGVNFNAEPVTTFNDLYQYVGVTATDKTKQSCAFSFVDFLLSSTVQKTLTQIKMASLFCSGLYADSVPYTALENSNYTYTISPFLTQSEVENIKEMAKEQILRQNYDDSVLKFLKQL